MRFRELTGGNLEDTLAGIAAARATGFEPLKLNAVLRRSTWREDIPPLLDYASAQGAEIRFIELMRTGTAADWAREEFVSAAEVQDWLKKSCRISPLLEAPSASARRSLAFWRGQELTIGWITPQTERFCLGCNRLRLDCQGRLRRCLMDPLSFPLIEALHSMKLEAVEASVLEYVQGKRPPLEMSTLDSMVAVGG